MSAEHFRRLERMYSTAPINALIPSRVTITEGRAEVALEAAPTLWHAGHSLHGSVYFKALDDAAFFAANSVVDDRFVLTVKFEVELLARVTDTQLRAVGTLDRREGKKLWATAELFTADGGLAARGAGLFLASGPPLSEASGYGDV